MSRKKKAASSVGIANDSFFLIKNQMKKKTASSFKKDLWLNKGKKGKYFFPYKKRHPLLIAMCGEYDQTKGIPDRWSTILASLLNSGDGTVVAYAQAMMNLSEEEWRSGTMDNKNFNKLCKLIGSKDKIEKPKLMAILDYMCMYHEVAIQAPYLKELFTKERSKDTDSVKIYISCDPWDILRMGVGKDSFGSCMNIEDGGYTQHLVQNFQDPTMAIVYAEDSKSDRRKLKGMRCRAILRMLKYGNEYGIVVDRYYGNQSYRISALKAVGRAAKKAGVKLLNFAHYKHTAGSQSISKNAGKETIASGPLMKFRAIVPYLDQKESGGFNEVLTKGSNIFVIPSYKVVETDEAAA